MKIRNGFVSNSSSSSFIVLLPENFDSSTLSIDDISNYTITDWLEENDKEEFTMEDLIQIVNAFIKNKGLYHNDSPIEYEIISNVLRNYVVKSIDVSSDCGEIILLDNNKIKKILGL